MALPNKNQYNWQVKPTSHHQPKSTSETAHSVQADAPPQTKNDKNMFRFRLIKGDLFTSPESSSLCHCISRDLGMGKGIAKVFKSKFGGLDTLRQQKANVGECAVLMRQNRYVYYLITKEKYWHKPTYESLTASLEYMKNHAVIYNVDEISMPKIGCGLDRLQWDKVERIIIKIFQATNIKISVYEL
mmetsp:Transcript_9967/g.15157  ORF Transcript_9967/g.15157 Transcript_9967/m.15157 type:complete len:187 (-) Transcript_9967:28-588(-)